MQFTLMNLRGSRNARLAALRKQQQLQQQSNPIVVETPEVNVIIQEPVNEPIQTIVEEPESESEEEPEPEPEAEEPEAEEPEAEEPVAEEQE